MFDLTYIAHVTGGELLAPAHSCQVHGVSTDSRKVSSGDLFIPLRGEHFDGHDYLSQAVKNGAVACLSEEVVAGLSVTVVRVENTLKALGDIASAWRMQLHGPLVAITGSAGKTTTKEMLATILDAVAPGLKTAGNFNNLIGLPLTLLNLKKAHQWAVVEMGTSALGEIERLTAIAAPTIGVMTNIGPAHLETLAGLDGVARAKGELFAGLKGGCAIVNLDDSRVAALPIANGVKRVTYGLSTGADVRAVNISEENGTVQFDLLVNGEAQTVTLAVPGQHNVVNALAAAAAAFELNISLNMIARGLERFTAVPGRMCLVRLSDGSLLLDDSYNSNPLSASAALDALSALNGQGRRIAVLGDMLELGVDAKKMHSELGIKAGGVADYLIAVGRFSQSLRQGALKSGLADEKIICVDSAVAAIACLNELRRSDDQILVKGSRGVQLDQVVDSLKAADLSVDSQREN